MDHWSPPCTTNTSASRKPRRWKDEPYGRTQDADLMQDSVVQVRVAKLAMAKHLVGDFFTIEHIFPTQMIEMDSYQELLALPGVFMLTWDNCEYDEVYRHRQVLITNHPAFANLSRDCDKMHTHVPITGKDGIPAAQICCQAWQVLQKCLVQ